MSYSLRAMELHDFVQIWNLDEIEKRLAFMVRNDMNALVFHEPGIEEKIVFPAKFLGGSGTAKSYYDTFAEIDHEIYYHALRENLNLNRRDYMNHLIRKAKASGVDVYFENKELWFKDFILTYKKTLFHDGVICPSDPFWYEEFLPQKYRELFIALPDLAGIVVSIGTGEARLSISNTYGCTCDRCKNLDPVEWYKNMILGIYKPFHEAGKRLIIRDFIYTKAEQERFRKAFITLPNDIWLSLKNTPHDFYPTFPNNPLIGNVDSHPQITEYDVQGQFYGWGASPSAMLEDIKYRLDYGTTRNVTGFIARTDWEGVQDWTCFDNLNLVNLYAIAMYANNPNSERLEIYRKWLLEENMVDSSIHSQELKSCIDTVASIMDKTWPIVEKVNYVNGTLFSNDSCLYLSVDQFNFIGGTHHSLAEWDPSKGDALSITKENIIKIAKDKDDAREGAAALLAEVEQGIPGLTEDAFKMLLKHFRFMSFYSQAFRLSARGYCFSRYAEEINAKEPLFEGKTAIELLQEVVTELELLKQQVQKSGLLDFYPFDAQLNPERFDYFANDLQKRLEIILK